PSLGHLGSAVIAATAPPAAEAIPDFIALGLVPHGVPSNQARRGLRSAVAECRAASPALWIMPEEASLSARRTQSRITRQRKWPANDRSRKPICRDRRTLVQGTTWLNFARR